MQVNEFKQVVASSLLPRKLVNPDSLDFLTDCNTRLLCKSIKLKNPWERLNLAIAKQLFLCAESPSESHLFLVQREDEIIYSLRSWESCLRKLGLRYEIPLALVPNICIWLPVSPDQVTKIFLRSCSLNRIHGLQVASAVIYCSDYPRLVQESIIEKACCRVRRGLSPQVAILPPA
jgi:hypothetical protein